MQREEQRMRRELEERRLEIEERKWKEEMELKRSEKSYRESPAVKIKNWGDALRNTITKMPSESVDVDSWFMSVEKLFEQLKVPDELQSVLIRPYLSDRAKILMSKCDQAHSVGYQNLKRFLLQEFQLSPSVYLDKFSTLVYDKNETYNQFSTRLMTLFEYYIESRKINRSYEKIVDLMIYDRIKSILPPYLARHVLALEAGHKDGWLGRLGLAEALDAYMANIQGEGRPRMTVLQPRNALVPGNGKWVAPSSTRQSTQPVNQPVNQQKPVPLTHGGGGRRCYICSSPNHISTTCPQALWQ